jgi:hypothetical protein
LRPAAAEVIFLSMTRRSMMASATVAGSKPMTFKGAWGLGLVLCLAFVAIKVLFFPSTTDEHGVPKWGTLTETVSGDKFISDRVPVFDAAGILQAAGTDAVPAGAKVDHVWTNGGGTCFFNYQTSTIDGRRLYWWIKGSCSSIKN